MIQFSPAFKSVNKMWHPSVDSPFRSNFAVANETQPVCPVRLLYLYVYLAPVVSCNTWPKSNERYDANSSGKELKA